MTWAHRLNRVLSIAMEVCPACGGAVRNIVCIEETEMIVKILTHLEAKRAAPDGAVRLSRPPQRTPSGAATPRGAASVAADGRRRGQKPVRERVVGRIRALECRSEPLGRSDRRPSTGAHEREAVVPAHQKRLYATNIEY